MISRYVLNAMSEDELRNYACRVETFLEQQRKALSAQISRANAYRDVANAVEYSRDEDMCLTFEKDRLRQLTIALEEKYKDVIPKPMMAAENYKPDTKGDAK